MYMSKRKFLTITGTYKGIPVSVVAICMVNIKTWNKNEIINNYYKI